VTFRWMTILGLVPSLTAVGLLQVPELAHAQARDGKCKEVVHARTDTLRSGSVRVPTPQEIDGLRILLRAGRCQLPQVRELFFGSTYTPNLADWIVYIGNGDTLIEALTQSNRVLTTPLVRGEKAVYVEAFVDGPLFGRGDRHSGQGLFQGISLPTDSLPSKESTQGLRDTTYSESLVIRRDILQHEVDPFLVRVIKGFNVFGGALNVGGEKAPADSEFVVALQDLGPGITDTRHLYFAFARIPITDDVWARLSVHSPTRRELRAHRTVLTNFVTTSRSRFAISLAGGVIINSRTRSFRTGADGRASLDTITLSSGTTTRLAERQVGAQTAANVYLVGHLRIIGRRPRPLRYHVGPVAFESVSTFVGTNLVRGTILDEVVGGFSFDRLGGGGASLLIGTARLATQVADSATRRVSQSWDLRMFLGVGFEL
jgi:hypothetical protein